VEAWGPYFVFSTVCVAGGWQKKRFGNLNLHLNLDDGKNAICFNFKRIEPSPLDGTWIGKLQSGGGEVVTTSISRFFVMVMFVKYAATQHAEYEYSKLYAKCKYK
jgi:hypothetical protein